MPSIPKRNWNPNRKNEKTALKGGFLFKNFLKKGVDK